MSAPSSNPTVGEASVLAAPVALDPVALAGVFVLRMPRRTVAGAGREA